jgi:hypothetical protein
VHDILDTQEQPQLFRIFTDNVHDMHNQRGMADILVDDVFDIQQQKVAVYN